jgi:hypothetical protein
MRAFDSMLNAVTVAFSEITIENREAVLALRVAPRQERFVSSVGESLAEAAEYRTPSRGVGRFGRAASPSGL